MDREQKDHRKKKYQKLLLLIFLKSIIIIIMSIIAFYNEWGSGHAELISFDIPKSTLVILLIELILLPNILFFIFVFFFYKTKNKNIIFSMIIFFLYLVMFFSDLFICSFSVFFLSIYPDNIGFKFTLFFSVINLIICILIIRIVIKEISGKLLFKAILRLLLIIASIIILCCAIQLFVYIFDNYINNYNVLENSIKNRNYTKIEELLKKNLDEKQIPWNIINESCDIEIFKLLIKNGYTIDHENKDGITGLQFAVKGNNDKAPNLELIKLFVDNGAHLNHIGYVHSILSSACEDTNDQNSLEVIRLLLNHGADPNMEDDNSSFPLFYCSDNCLKIIQLLYDKGANVNSQNSYRITPLINAVRNNNNLAAEKLLLLGAKLDVTTDENLAPINFCKDDNDMFIINLLVKKGANVNILNNIDSSGNTALHYAVENEQNLIAKKIVSLAGNPSIINNNDETPLIMSIKSYNKDLINLLKKSGGNELLNLTEIRISCDKTDNLSLISDLSNLKEIEISGKEISDISVLSMLTKLESLTLNCDELTNISAINKLENLKSLTLICNNLTNISAISKLENLENLENLTIEAEKLEQINDFNKLNRLKSLAILNCNRIKNINPLKECKNLEELNIQNVSISQEDVKIISNIKTLKKILIDSKIGKKIKKIRPDLLILGIR